MSGTLFVDTGAWFALQVPDDRWHPEAAEVLRKATQRKLRLLTSNLVVGETYTLLLKTHGHAAAWRFKDALERSPRLEIQPVDEQAEAEGYALMRRFSDQAFSYVDGTSFALMRRLKVRDAFAFDRHFAAAGFTRVPVDAPVG